MPVTPVLGSAAEEVPFTYPAQVASTAATTCKRVGRNGSASHRYGGGNDDHDSVQHKLTFPRSAGCDNGQSDDTCDR
jgi:hypothetical protein